MATITWPNALNHVLDRNSFSIELHPENARTEFDDGPALVRSTFVNPISVYNGTITVTDAEYFNFLGFYTHLLSNGTRWFEIPVWDSLGYVAKKVRFKKRFEIADQSYNQYTLGISLEVKEYYKVQGFAYYLYYLYGEEFAIDLADRLQIIVNETYPEVMQDYV